LSEHQENIRYSIDYIMLAGYYSDNEAKVIKKLINKIKKQNGKEIIIENFDRNCVKSLARLVLGFGFKFDTEKQYPYKIL